MDGFTVVRARAIVFTSSVYLIVPAPGNAVELYSWMETSVYKNNTNLIGKLTLLYENLIKDYFNNEKFVLVIM